MTSFYSRVFVDVWNAILFLFSVGSIATVIMMYKQGQLSTLQQAMIFGFSWLGIAVFLGAMSLGISGYEKLCRLVELKEKELSKYKQDSIPEKEKIEPII